uniref:Plexin B2 n=1 Tax=Astyanax mexicanus TaxID=7994 RepID=A0A8B9L539_ASTMX
MFSLSEMAWWCVVALLMLLCMDHSSCDQPHAQFSSQTDINTVVQDPRTGRIYLGAVNNIYQLDARLQKESAYTTGPRMDNPSCTPPITNLCTEAKNMNNINKLLLVNSDSNTLVVCGSIFRGICSLLNLSHVDNVIYFSDSKGEKTYVATTEETVSVVGVISRFKKGEPEQNLTVFLVGKGYGGSDSSKLISTRLLQDYQELVRFENVVEASTVQASPFVQRYLHDFRHAFKDSGHIYFLFSRTTGSSDSRKITFVARLCESDDHYYSYTELQLNCSTNGENTYNKVQSAAYLGTPGHVLAQNLSLSSPYGELKANDKVLFVVFSSDEDSSMSALCMYPLSSINRRLEEVIESCYRGELLSDDKPKSVYSPYSSKTEAICNTKREVGQKDIMTKYPCGAEFLPSPLASKPEYALTVSPAYTRKGMLTAVAVAVENENTVGFLGTSQGEVIKVSYFEGTVSNAAQRSIIGEFSICSSHSCTRKTECGRGEEKNGWLWSPNQQCVTIQAFEPPNISCKKTKQQEKCPQFENADPLLIPVGYKTPIQFEGKNLEKYMVRMVLYNCSVGREDCSLCKNADEKYGCVWCATTRSCIYRDRCTEELPQCPDPSITDIVPRYGPMNGSILVTIKGSNLGIKKEDIKRITVAGMPCVHKAEKYSVSTRYYVHNVLFLAKNVNQTDPIPEKVHPIRGPAQGGTVITITGQYLDTASKEDISVQVAGVPCEVQVQKSVSDCFYVLMCALQGRGLSKAMTAEEAQAFVGDAPCTVNSLHDDKLILQAPSTPPRSRSRRQRRDTSSETMELVVKFGHGEWNVGSVQYEKKNEVPLFIIIPAVLLPMLFFIAVSVYCYRRKSQQAEREYEKVKQQLESLEESVRDRCKKEFTDLMIEMEDHTSDMSEARIPFLDYKTYTDRVFFLPSKDGANDVMITGKLDIPENRRAIVDQALNQFSNLLNSKTFLINFIRTLESQQEFNARSKVYFASLLTVALHGKLEYYTDIMRTLLLELMEEYIHSKNPKLMLRRSETVVERMLCNWMSICLYQFLKDSAGEPLYKLFKAIKHQVEKGPVDAKMKKAKYTLNDTGLLGDDVEYFVLVSVLVHGEGPDVTPVKVLNCDTISQVKEKIIEQVYRNLPYSQRPTVDSVALEWRPGSTGQILSDLDLTSQKEGRWKRLNTLAHYNVRDNATLVLSRVLHTQQSFDQNQDSHEERSALLEDDKVFHLVRPADELDDVKSKRGSMKDKATTKAITEIYLTRLLSMKGTLQQFVDDFFRSVLCTGTVVPPAVKYFFDFLDEQAHKHENVDEETIHIWKTNSLPLRFWVNILKNPHFIFDVHVTEVVDASLSVIAQTFMDACTKTEHKLTRESPSNKLLYAKEISTYKKMVDDYYKGIRQMVSVSDQDMNTHLAEVSRSHTEKLNTQVALHQLYQYASKYYDGIISSLEEDPAAQSKQLTLRLQQIAAALENKVTDL